MFANRFVFFFLFSLVTFLFMAKVDLFWFFDLTQKKRKNVVCFTVVGGVVVVLQ